MALVSSEAKPARCFDLWRGRQKEAHEARGEFEEWWDMSIRFLMNDVEMEMPPGAEWMRAELLPEFFGGNESLVAQNCLTLLVDPRPVIVEAPQLQGISAQRRIETLLDIQRHRARFNVNMVPAVRIGMAQGHIIQKNYWLRQYETRWEPFFAEPTTTAEGDVIPGRIIDHRPVEAYAFNGPYTTYCDLRRTWKSPATDWQGRPLWWMELISKDIDDLYQQDKKFRARNDNEPLYDAEALRSLRTSQSFNRWDAHTNASGGVGQTSAWERSTASETARTSDTQLRGKNSVDLMQCWGYVPIADHGGFDYDDTQMRIQLFTPDGQLLRDDPLMYMPYRDIYIMRFGDEPYGRTPLWWTLNEIEQMSEIRNLRLAETWINMLGGYIIDRSVDWDTGDWIKYPGFVWPYDGDGRSPNEVMMQVQKNPVLPEAYHETNDIFGRIQRTAGTDLNSLGQAYGARTAATEVAMIDRKSGARTRLQTALLTWQGVRSAMDDYYHLNQMFLDEGEDIQLPNDPGTLERLYAHNLDFDVIIKANSAEFGAMNQQTLQGITQTLGMFFEDAEMRMHFDKRELAEDLLYRSGSPAALRVLRKEEDVQRDQQAMQEYQMALALAQGGTGGARPA